MLGKVCLIFLTKKHPIIIYGPCGEESNYISTYLKGSHLFVGCYVPSPRHGLSFSARWLEFRMYAKKIRSSGKWPPEASQ